MTTTARAQITAEIFERTGIDEDLIGRVVRAFYERVRADDFIGPIFTERITDWELHLQQMCAFWSSVALLTGRYHGQPMPRHMPLPIDAQHFDRWISLFAETVRELCTPAAADHFIERARRIAESLEMGIANGHGVLLDKGQRFLRD